MGDQRAERDAVRSGTTSLDVEHELRVRYLLRVVRIGVLATFVVLVPVGLYPFATSQAEMARPALYAGAVAVGLLGAGVVPWLPWERMLNARVPMLGFSLWSLADIALISLLVLATNGIASPLWVVYALTTLFFAAAYPRRIQVLMFGATAVAYAAAVHSGSPTLGDHAGELAVRLGILATLALMAGFISGELTHQMAVQARRAGASRRVAEAGAQISTLRHQGIFDAAVDAVADLGVAMCAVVLTEGRTYRIAAARGLPEDFTRVRLALSELRPGTQAWVMRPDDIDDPEVLEMLDRTGSDSVVVAPLTVASRRIGLLAAVCDEDPVVVEAIQTLAMLTVNALENAELYQLKADFVANVSHELRTPLTVLVGLGETLAHWSDDLTGEQLQHLGGRVQTHAMRLEAMISRLLDFSRLQTSQRRIHADELDLARMVAEAVERTQAQLSPRRVETEVDAGAGVVGDELMLEQVLDNLLANVASHTPPDTVARITVRTLDTHVEVAVTDDGPGIPPAEAQRVTERFFRGGDHLTRNQSGLGLGLALVQELLTLHGSELEISASPDGGTRAAFRLRSTANVIDVAM